MFEDILDKIESKGWNVYDAGERMEQNLFTIVPQGNVHSLKKDRHYLVLPHLQNSCDIIEMQRALEDMDLRQEFPLLRYRQLIIPMAAFLVEERGFTLHSYKEIFLISEEFHKALDTLVDRTIN